HEVRWVRDEDRAWRAAGRGVEGARNELWGAGGIADHGRPFGDRPEHRAVIELLEGLALAHLARNLADEQNERGGILPRDMHSRLRIGGAWPARDEADAGSPGRLAAGFRHDGGPALLPANSDGDIAVVEGVERRDIALAGHAK